MKGLSLLLLVMLTASCTWPIGSAGTATSTPAAATEMPRTKQPTGTGVPTASGTVAPAPTPTSAVAELLPVYSLPAWMGDAASPILVANIADELQETRKLSFFNAESGESYEIALPESVGGFLWDDATHFGILSRDQRILYRMDTATGRIQEGTASARETRLLSPNFEGDLRWIPDPMDPTMKVLNGATPNNQSDSLVYFARWIEGDQGSTLEVVEREGGKVVWESDAIRNVWGTDLAWSPASVNTLAYVQGQPEPVDGFITEEMHLTIVDVSKGEILSSHPGKFGEIQWSPDGRKILYLDPWLRYRMYGFGFKDAPCILDVPAGTSTCLRKIPDLVPSGYSLATTGVYRWSPDGSSFFYTYLYTSADGQMLGNLCVYELASGDIDCPTQGLGELEGRSILGYDLSPNGELIHFCYSASSILNDYLDTAKDGVIKMDGTGFFSWVGTITVDGIPFCSSHTLWRPMP